VPKGGQGSSNLPEYLDKVLDIFTIILFVPESVGKSAEPGIPVGRTGDAAGNKIIRESTQYGKRISTEDCVGLHHNLAI